MKKNNLFKAVGVVILTYILMSWIVPIIYGLVGTEADVSYQIGFVSILSVILETFSGFGTVVLYVLLVGAFYGVLKVTGAYEKVMELLCDKAKGKEKGVLISIIVVMAIISSISGLDLGLLVVFPILIGLIVKMGYDKLVALSATVGATIVGMYGATFAGTLYGVNSTVLGGLERFDQIIPKVIFLVAGVAALVIFVLMYCKKKNFDKKDVKLSASKGTNVKKAGASKKATNAKKDTKAKKATTAKKETKTKKENKSVVESKKDENKAKKSERSAIPALVIIAIVMLVFFVGTTSWETIFGKNLLGNAHEAWTGFKIGGFEILSKLFGGVDAMGTWNTPLRFQIYSMILVFAMIAIAIVYRTKLDECFEGFVDGIKSFVVPAILTILACSMFVFVYYNPVINTVSSLLLTKNFNVALSGIYTIINSVFYVDYYYLSASVLAGLAGVYTDASVLSILSVMFTNLYSLVMLIAPTSVLLLVSLSISEVKYTDWVKFIWKLALTLLIVSFIVFSVMLMI